MSDTQFPAKWLKKLPIGFVDNVESMSNEEVKKIILESEANIYTIEKEKEKDVKLNGAKDLVKEYSASYNEAKSTQQAKIKYCLFLLEGRGIALDSK
jgi:hypothetical protein